MRQLADLVGAGDIAGGAVLLGGDAGAGKSRLVAELSARVAGDGWRVLDGHCLDFGDSSPPYLPFSEALGRLAAESPRDTESLVETNPAIAGLLPAHRLLTDSDNAPAPTGRAALFDAVHNALTQLSEDAPLLLIVEDLHWADQSTRDLLRVLFTRQFSSPVAILATYRSDDLHRRHPLRGALAEWVRLPTVSRLQSRPLNDAEARQLIDALHPEPLPKREVKQILARAEGNPFFIEELVAATEVGGGALPTDLADLLLVRLEQLDAAGQLAVRAAAVSGRRVSHTLLAHGTDLNAGALEDALRAAVEANILVALSGDGYAFRHALLGEAIYRTCSPANESASTRSTPRRWRPIPTKAQPPSCLAMPVPRTTSSRRLERASRPVTRRWLSAGPRRRFVTTSWHWSSSLIRELPKGWAPIATPPVMSIRLSWCCVRVRRQRQRGICSARSRSPRTNSTHFQRMPRRETG